MKSSYPEIEAYVTKDGSVIRELMHPQVQGNRNQSLAEAIVARGAQTALHLHPVSEELYHVTQGTGEMTLGEAVFPVSSGDTICIAPGMPHRIRNTGEIELRILCACSPPYSHEDTQLL
ncbi:MAG: cupin domain-containing protein [Burkholderiales bacterium]|nr:cupin domain-containing protein [Burkholderiales bacterium]